MEVRRKGDERDNAQACRPWHPSRQTAKGLNPLGLERWATEIKLLAKERSPEGKSMDVVVSREPHRRRLSYNKEEACLVTATVSRDTHRLPHPVQKGGDLREV